MTTSAVAATSSAARRPQPVGQLLTVWFAAVFSAAIAGCAAAPDAPTQADTPLAMTLSGLGPVNADTVFDADAIAPLLPQHDVEWARYAGATSADDTVVVLVSQGGRSVAEIHPDASGTRVGRIDALTRSVEGPFGGRVGDTLGSLRAPGVRCTEGVAASPGTALCGGRTAPNVIYLVRFAGKPAGTLPEREQLRKATVSRIIWSAPA